MIWNKPRKAWQWSLLFLPAALSLAAIQIQAWLEPIPVLHYTNGMQVQPSLVRMTRELSMSFLVLVPDSLIIALVLSHGVSVGQRIINTLFFLLCLLAGNGLLLGLGCGVSHAARPIAPLPIAFPPERHEDAQSR